MVDEEESEKQECEEEEFDEDGKRMITYEVRNYVYNVLSYLQHKHIIREKMNLGYQSCLDCFVGIFHKLFIVKIMKYIQNFYSISQYYC